MGQLLRTRGTKAKSHIHAINNVLTSNVVLTRKSQTMALLYRLCYCTVNTAGSQFGISSKDPTLS